MPNEYGDLTNEDMRRLSNVLDILAPRLHIHGKLIDLPLNADDWQAVWAAHQGFLYACQYIAKRAIQREMERRAEGAPA